MSHPLTKRIFRFLVGAALLGLVVWLFYFDSHNILDRWSWTQEYQHLREQNEQLQQDIEELQSRLEEPPPDSLIERIAREEYGMSKPGETIYRLPSSQD